MKRQLSLVLALVMILGTFTTVFAADTSADAITEASTFLKDKGVLVGNMKGDLMLGEKLSRQDTAVLVARLMGELKIAQEFPTAENIPTYEDVKDDFYLPILAWAQANKTFVGHSDARFGFDDNVTAQEYSKVLLVALGYDVGPNGNNDLTWEATLAKAKELGILKDIDTDVKNTDEITRGEMAVMTFNALGVMMKDGTQTLAEKLGIVMPAPTKLTAEVKDTKNLKEVVVELSNAKLADADKLQDEVNYKIDGVTVKEAKLDGNDVILTLEKALVKGRDYKLTVRNVETGVNGTYNFKALDNTQPEVEKVEVLGEYGIKVTTTEPIKDAKERNFLVDGRNVSMKIETYGRDIILTPYYNEAFPNNADTLTIKELEDFAGYKSVEKDFDIKIVKDDVAPKVTDVVSRGNIVEVTFDKDIYEKSVAAYGGRTSLGNISYQSGRVAVYAEKADKIATNKVRYTFEDELLARTSVTIQGVQNHSKVTMDKVTQVPRLELDYSEPQIINKDVVTKQTANATTFEAEIELKFDKAVEGNFIDENNKKAGFEVKKHFTLFEREVNRGLESNANIVSAEYKLDSNNDIMKDTIIVKITGLTKYNKDTNDLNYVLEVENFTDATSLRNRMYRDYVDFKATAKDDFKIEKISHKAHYRGTEVTITVNKSLDKVIAEQVSNYLFQEKAAGSAIKDLGQLQGEVYAEQNGKVITIILPEDKFDIADYGTMTILNNIRDIDGNRFATPVKYDFATGLTSEQVLTIEQELATLVTKANTAPYNANPAVMAALALPTGTIAEKEAAVKALDLAIKAVDKATELATADSRLSAAVTPATTGYNTGTLEELNVKTLALQAQALLIDPARTAEAVNTLAEKLENAMDIADATLAVATAESTKTNATRTAAQNLVTALPSGAVKTALQGRLDAIVTQEDDLAQANADITAAKAALTAELNGDPNVANNLTLSPATNGTTVAWASSDATLLTHAGVGVNGTGGLAVLTATIDKTVNGQSGATQTKVYNVVVNADGTINSIALQ